MTSTSGDTVEHAEWCSTTYGDHDCDCFAQEQMDEWERSQAGEEL